MPPYPELSTGRRPMASPRSSGRRRSEEHTSELQSRQYLVCRLLLEKQKEREARGALVASQVAGLVMMRYVLRLEPLASQSEEQSSELQSRQYLAYRLLLEIHNKLI